MAEFFLAQPDQLDAKIAEWRDAAAGNLRVDSVTSYSGPEVCAITLTDPAVERSGKRAMYFSQPHAHEPGATAGMMDVLEQLVTGKDLLGEATSIDVERVLARSVLTFNPIGNAEGRSRAPVLYWDGSRHSNDEFWCWMRGEDPENPGHMWERYDIWDDREVRAPDPVGIVYERIDEHRWVEPNRSQRSSFFRLFHMMDAEFRYDRWLDLHQTEFVGSEYTCMILLPLEGLATGSIGEANRAWGRAVVEAWLGAGYAAMPDPKPLSYTGTQAEYFRRNWGPLHARMSILATEVKNNAPDAAPGFQMKAQATAIERSIEALLE